MKKLDTRLLRSIKHHKGQFIATMLVIAVGIMTYMTFRMDEINLEGSLNDYYNDTHFADIFVDTVSVPESVVEDLLGIEGVAMAEGRLVFDVPLKVADPDEKVSVRVISFGQRESHVNDIFIYEGRPLGSDSRDAYVIRTFADARGIKLGDTLQPQIMGEVVDLEVVGKVASPEFVYVMESEQTLMPLPDKFGVVYISEKLAMQAFGMNGAYNHVIIRAEAGTDVYRLKNTIEDRLDRYGVRRIYLGENQLSNRIVQEEIDQREISSRTIPMVFLLVASVIMIEMMRRNVKNDRIAIGILKSIGYSNLQIMVHYAKYCLLIGFVGGLVGALIGTATGAALSQWEATVYFNIPYMKARIYLSYFVYAVGGAMLVSLLAGLWGAREVINIHPALAMRLPQPKVGKRIWLETSWIWKWITFTEKVVVRNIMRNKKRFAFIVAGIALTYAISIVPMYMMNMFDVIFRDHYTDFIRYDYSVNFNGAVSESSKKEIRSLIESGRVEGKIEFPFKLVKDWRSKDITVIGVDRNTRMFTFKDLNHRSVKLPKEGMFVTETYAATYGVKEGDIIRVKNFIPGKPDVDVPVVKVIKQSLGLNAYMDLTYMQSNFMDAEMINGVFIQTDHALGDQLSSVERITSVQSIADLKGIFEEFLGLMIASIGTMLVFAGIMGFAIVYNTTIISILERRMEFSSMRIMGFTKNEIFFITLRENVIMTLFGILIGIPMGMGLLNSMSEAFSSELYRMDPIINPSAYMTTALAVLVYVLFAQLATYSRIRRLDFIEALKSRMT